MPLQASVSLGRKISANYQSTSVQVTLVAELSADLAGRPELQTQLDGLFAQAQSALERQVKAYAGETAPQIPELNNGNGENSRRHGTNGIGHTNGHGHRNGGGVTKSQARAIEAIADRAGLDAAQEAHDLFGVELDELTINQASELIDVLKTQAPASNGNRR